MDINKAISIRINFNRGFVSRCLPSFHRSIKLVSVPLTEKKAVILNSRSPKTNQ